MNLVSWLRPLGMSTRLAFSAFSLISFRNLTWQDFQTNCSAIGLKSFHMVALSAVFVAIALVMQCAIELHKFQQQDLSGAVISIGLLREIGPLTIGLAWSARVAAFVSNEAKQYIITEDQTINFAQTFILPKYIATLAMAIPLSIYGVTIGFLTGAFVAPLFGVSSTSDFLESARLAIHNQDLIIYFVKLILIFPLVAIFAGSTAALTAKDQSMSVPTNAITATFICGYLANLATTIALYYH